MHHRCSLVMTDMQNIFQDAQKPILPMLLSNWIFGIGIIEYPVGRRHRTISFLYSAFTLIMYYWINVHSFPYIFSIARRYDVNREVVIILFYCHVLLAFGAMILGWQRSKDLRAVFMKIAFTDCLMEKIGIAKNYDKIFIEQVKKIGKQFIFILSFVVITTMSLNPENCHNISSMLLLTLVNYPMIVLFFVDAMFVNIIEYIHYKMNKLNNVLSSLIDVSNDFPQHTKIVQNHFNKIENRNQERDDINKDKEFIIQTAKKIHLELAESCQLIDNTFGLHILMSLSVAIAIITSSLYQSYCLLTSEYRFSRNDLFRFVDSNFCWLIYYLVKIYLISNSCSTIFDETMKTGDIISELYDEPSTNEEAKEKIREFQNQLIQNKIKFEARGYIALDNTLIQTFIGSITTYLMILIQLGGCKSRTDN